MSPYSNHNKKLQQAAALKYAPEGSQQAPVVALLTQLQVGSEIPPELYQAVVDLYVYFLNFPAPTE